MIDGAAARMAAVGELEDLYPLLATSNFGPGWKRPEPSIWAQPRKNFLPAQWRGVEARAALTAAAKCNVNTEMAERRNLIMVNPLPGNIYSTVRTLISAYQLVLPHENARSHRHSPNALRLVLDAGPDTFTIVNGSKIPMQRGDVVLTPNWAWHGHENEGSRAAFWIDFLDVPTVQLLEPMFFEPFPQRIEKATSVDPTSSLRFRWSDDRGRLALQLPAAPGWRVLELGPTTLETITLTRWNLDAGAVAAPLRSTANAIIAVVEGEGIADIDGASFNWSSGDVLAIPSWRPHSVLAKTPSSLLHVSDEAMLRRLNWYRTG